MLPAIFLDMRTSLGYLIQSIILGQYETNILRFIKYHHLQYKYTQTILPPGHEEPYIPTFLPTFAIIQLIGGNNYNRDISCFFGTLITSYGEYFDIYLFPFGISSSLNYMSCPLCIFQILVKMAHSQLISSWLDSKTVHGFLNTTRKGDCNEGAVRVARVSGPR